MSNSAGSLDTLMKGKPLGVYDRRRKLTDKDKEEIREMHKRGESIHGIARAFKGVCSKRLIQFVLFPERLKRLQDRNKRNKNWAKYHDRTKLTPAVREWRRHKKELFKQGKLK